MCQTRRCLFSLAALMGVTSFGCDGTPEVAATTYAADKEHRTTVSGGNAKVAPQLGTHQAGKPRNFMKQ
jgi:hypothetical protein